MQKIKFYKLYPSGNPTILVEDINLNSEQRVLAAKELLEYLQAEQVGFIDCSTNTLTMMGGEFCINATRSFAHLLADKATSLENDVWTGDIYTSSQKIKAIVHKNELNSALLIDYSNFVIKSLKKYTYVILDGITHILVPTPSAYLDNFDYIAESNNIRSNLALHDLAVGVIWYQQEKENYSIIPIVHVTATASNYYESACGTGSLALALYLHEQQKISQVTIFQPSKMSLQVNFMSPNQVQISGISKVIAEGYAYLYSI